MDSMTAFARAKAAQGNEQMVFDWEKAARLILEHKATYASAGLRGDWEWTGGPIFADGEPVPKDQTYVYLASNHAEPELELNGDMIECYRPCSETPGWRSDTYWPQEALNILATDNGT